MATERARRTAKEAREAILDVAERHLAAGGPAAVRVQRIAAGLGVTDAAVHYHFGSRGKLMTALLRRAGRKLRATFEEIFARENSSDLIFTIMDRLDETYRTQGFARLAMWLKLDGWKA